MKHNSVLKDKLILVTGGAGFIGSNLCEYLLSIGSRVRCMDNFSTGNKKNIKNIINHENFSLIHDDIRDIDACQNACKNVEYVLHQAALGSVPRSINDPITSNEVNVNGFLNIIAARDNNVNRVVYAASSSTYGDSKNYQKLNLKLEFHYLLMQ